MIQTPVVTMKRAQRNMIIALVAATLAVNSIILLSGDVESKNYYGNVLRPVVAAVATGIAILVVYRQKTGGFFGRSYAAIAAGLGLWLIAEVLWGYYSIGLGIEVPFPSLADAFWLAGYGPFGYALFMLAKVYSYGKHKKNSATMIITIISVVIFASWYIAQLLSAADLSSPEGVTGFAISAAYPTLDAIVIIPSLLAVTSAGRGYLTSVPWIFVSWIFFVVADAIFGFTAVTSIAGEVSIWNLFYNAGYLTMAVGLIWHYRFMLFDAKRKTITSSA